jgi:hypothetical protein
MKEDVSFCKECEYYRYEEYKNNNNHDFCSLKINSFFAIKTRELVTMYSECKCINMYNDCKQFIKKQ